MWLTESMNCLLYSNSVHLAKCYQTLGMISSTLGCINEREEKGMENVVGRLSHSVPRIIFRLLLLLFHVEMQGQFCTAIS